MRAIRLSFHQMILLMRRDMMLLVSCLTPILAGLFFRFGIPLLEEVLRDCFSMAAVISPYYRLADIFFAMLTPIMFCFAAAMVSLEERDEKTAVYLYITPLGKTGYIAARFGVPAAAAFLVTVVLLPFFKLTALSATAVLLLAAVEPCRG